MSGLNQKAKVAILRVLRETHDPVGSSRIADGIQAFGHELSPRTIRVYLEEMESEGLVAHARRGRSGGRTITQKGIDEIGRALVLDRVGMTAVKVDNLAWQMDFDLRKRAGEVVLNISTINERALPVALRIMKPVYAAGMAMGEYLTVFPAGTQLDEVEIPAGMVGIGTVCSVTVNGVLLNRRVPTISRFGGVLELEDGEPARFTEVIYYDGTSLDPLEIFIKGRLMRVQEAVNSGHGRIGASFREFPTSAAEEVRNTLKAMQRTGLGGEVLMGRPNQPVLGFPVHEGRTGFIIAGGLNPVAAVEEAGIQTESFAFSQLYDFEALTHYTDIELKLGIPPRRSTRRAQHPAPAPTTPRARTTG